MEAILFGLLINVITRLSGKVKLSKTYVSVLLCLIGGSLYYVATNYYAIQWNQLLVFVTGAYATSQLLYNLFKKWGILEKIGIRI